MLMETIHLTNPEKSGWKNYQILGEINMPEKSLTERIEKYTKIVANKQGVSDSQLSSILELIKSVRLDGVISDEDLLSFFELVGE